MVARRVVSYLYSELPVYLWNLILLYITQQRIDRIVEWIDGWVD